MPLTKIERETIIIFNEAEDTGTCYTCNTSLKQKFSIYAEQNPDLCKLIRMDEHGSMTFRFDKSRLSLRLIQPLTEKQREKRSESMKRNRQALKGGDAEQE